MALFKNKYTFFVIAILIFLFSLINCWFAVWVDYGGLAWSQDEKYIAFQCKRAESAVEGEEKPWVLIANTEELNLSWITPAFTSLISNEKGDKCILYYDGIWLVRGPKWNSPEFIQAPRDFYNYGEIIHISSEEGHSQIFWVNNIEFIFSIYNFAPGTIDVFLYNTETNKKQKILENVVLIQPVQNKNDFFYYRRDYKKKKVELFKFNVEKKSSEKILNKCNKYHFSNNGKWIIGWTKEDYIRNIHKNAAGELEIVDSTSAADGYPIDKDKLILFRSNGNFVREIFMADRLNDRIFWENDEWIKLQVYSRIPGRGTKYKNTILLNIFTSEIKEIPKEEFKSPEKDSKLKEVIKLLNPVDYEFVENKEKILYLKSGVLRLYELDRQKEIPVLANHGYNLSWKKNNKLYFETQLDVKNESFFGSWLVNVEKDKPVFKFNKKTNAKSFLNEISTQTVISPQSGKIAFIKIVGGSYKKPEIWIKNKDNTNLQKIVESHATF